jgi:hypothetical protein
MPTVLNTGQTLTLSINSIARSEQITSARITPSTSRNRYKLIGNTETQKLVDTTYTMDVSIMLDWSSGTSDFADALWTAYTSAPDTPIAYSLVSNGQTFTGNLYPEMPPVGGAADDVHTWDATFQLTGVPTKA